MRQNLLPKHIRKQNLENVFYYTSNTIISEERFVSAKDVEAQNIWFSELGGASDVPIDGIIRLEKN